MNVCRTSKGLELSFVSDKSPLAQMLVWNRYEYLVAVKKAEHCKETTLFCNISSIFTYSTSHKY